MNKESDVSTRHLETVKKINHIPPASQGAGTVNGAAIDTAGFDAISFEVLTGVIDAAITVDFKVQESDDGSTGWADIAGAAITQLTGADDNQNPTIDLRLGGRAAGTRKRYLRGVLTVAGTGTALCAVGADLAAPHDAPVTNSPATVFV